MPPVPAVPGAKVVKALEKLGFSLVRITGSHHIMRHADGCSAAVPVHAGRDMAKGILRSIMNDTGLTNDDLT